MAPVYARAIFEKSLNDISIADCIVVGLAIFMVLLVLIVSVFFTIEYVAEKVKLWKMQKALDASRRNIKDRRECQGGTIPEFMMQTL